MAAGSSFRLVFVYLILAFLANKFCLYATGKISKVNTFATGNSFDLDGSGLFQRYDEVCLQVVKFKSIKFTSRTRIRRESSVWMKYGIQHVQTPDLDFLQDLTICVDVESSPGDIELLQKSSSS